LKACLKDDRSSSSLNANWQRAGKSLNRLETAQREMEIENNENA